MTENKVYLALNGLKARLPESAQLHIQSTGGQTWFVTFRFNEAATESQITSFFERRNWAVPDEYRQFLRLHNGAILFTLPDRGGGGVDIFSLEKMEFMRREYEYMFPDHCYPVAMFNTAMILINSEAYIEGKSYLFWQDCINTNEFAIDLKMDFATWLELLIIAQGSEHWFWPTFIPSIP